MMILFHERKHQLPLSRVCVKPNKTKQISEKKMFAISSISTTMAATSSSHKSRKRSFQINPLTTQDLSFTSLLLFIFFFILCASFVPTNSAEEPAILTSDFENSYSRHCNHIVHRSPSRSDRYRPSGFGASDFQIGYFKGGIPLFNQTPTTGGAERPQSVLFRPFGSGTTFADGVHRYRATLYLRDPALPYSGGRNLRLVRFRGPRFPLRNRRVSFALQGFWSESSRKLCMVGSGRVVFGGTVNSLHVVLKLNYPLNSTINSSLISGSLESLDDNGSSSYFSPISILALSEDSNYDYTLIGKENDNGCLNGDDKGGIFLPLPNFEGCSVLGGMERFDLVYGDDCKGVNCNPLGRSFGYVPSYMFYHRTRCDEGNKWKMLLGFSNSNNSGRFPFEPSTTFIAEGEWNKENQFCAVACQILNYTKSFDDAYVGNCSTGFKLRFPASLSLRNMSNVVGQIWSTSAANSLGHFDKIGFRGFNEELLGLSGVKYEYTVIDTLREICVKKSAARSKGKTYPNEYSLDMRFDMSVRNSKGQVASGYSAPFFVGNQLYRYQLFRTSSPHLTQAAFSVAPNSSQVNISYKISFTPPPDFKFSHDSSLSNAVEMSAEGTYDKDTGVLCMTGCRHLGSNTQNLDTNDTLDCEVNISIQFSPLNANTRKSIKGTIESTRKKSDPLYFGRLELSSISIYTGQAAASIWRMDLEITMVLISNTLTCLFVGLQLFYIKSHPDILPFISIVMLTVLTMGQMIPLLLNFEALFVPNRSQQSLFLGSGGWLEVNEVIVRVVTMVAFLLLLRLLQLTWSSRQGNGNERNLWSSERKVLYLTLPLCVSGALIAWFVNHMKNASGISHRAFPNPHRKAYIVSPFRRHSFQQHSLWNDLKSYAGLVMDGFLLPQILFNLFSNSGEKALAPPFYTGTTMVRLLPHAYDLYRAHAYASYLDLSYIYASHRMDFYSTAWDIVIPCCGLLFAVLISFQQRFGGHCILPRRFRQNSVYEKVPVISNDDL